MLFKAKTIFVGLFLAIAFFYFTFINFVSASLEVECEWGRIELAESNLSKEAYTDLLEKCKVYYQEKSDQMEQGAEGAAEEKTNLSNQIRSLASKISSLNYQISQGNIMIKDLSGQINNTQSSIDQTTLKIADIKGKLINLLQLRYEEDQRSTIEILLAEKKMSDFFDNLVALEVLNVETQELLKNIKDLKTDLEVQKVTMDSEKGELENLVIIQTMQKQDSAVQKTNQEDFLRLTEIEYQSYLQEQKSAEEIATKIGNLLFQLLEVPDGGIKFEDAVIIAKSISKQTGVRAAFSLAVLWQETRIGQLKGGCFLKDIATGDGIYIKSGNKAPRTMKPTARAYEKRSNTEDFLSIIKGLNDTGKLKTDAYHTPVSCAMIRDGSYFGWGGAMGPAQFIPSTWLSTAPEIEKNTGDAPANPWNVRDAFMANSIYLSRLGATAQTYEKEIYSAMRYFGCTSWWCRVNYGVPVMNAAECLDNYITNGSMSTSCRNLVF